VIIWEDVWHIYEWVMDYHLMIERQIHCRYDILLLQKLRVFKKGDKGVYAPLNLFSGFPYTNIIYRPNILWNKYKHFAMISFHFPYNLESASDDYDDRECLHHQLYEFIDKRIFILSMINIYLFWWMITKFTSIIHNLIYANNLYSLLSNYQSHQLEEN